MNKIAIYLLLLVILDSCATIINTSTTKISVYSNRPSRLTVNNSTYNFDRECKIYVERNSDSLIMYAESDSLKRTIKLKSKNSLGYYANIFYNCGVGCIIDYNNPKRYTYQNDIFIDYTSHSDRVSRFGSVNKGQINLNLSLPWVNQFVMHPQNEAYKSSIGFWGISAGLDFFYKEDKFISITASGVMDFFLPFPAAVDLSGEFDLMSSSYYSLTDNINFRNFTIGYGLNYSNNTWDHRYYDSFDAPPPTREPVVKSSKSLGFTINSYYRISKHFYLGLIYRPTVIRIKPSYALNYEHLISLDFLWKLRIKR
ncbi:MAG: hypothetical protein AB7S48_00675 [Bacteroidales bacterium]